MAKEYPQSNLEELLMLLSECATIIEGEYPPGEPEIEVAEKARELIARFKQEQMTWTSL